MIKSFSLILLAAISLTIFSCSKTDDARISGDPCALTGVVSFMDAFGGYKIKIDGTNKYVQPLVAQNVHCPVFDDMFVEEGLRVQFSYRELNHKIEGDINSGIPDAEAVTLLCITQIGEPVPEHNHH